MVAVGIKEAQCLNSIIWNDSIILIYHYFMVL